MATVKGPRRGRDEEPKRSGSATLASRAGKMSPQVGKSQTKKK